MRCRRTAALALLAFIVAIGPAAASTTVVSQTGGGSTGQPWVSNGASAPGFGAMGCAGMPALTGDVTTSSASCTTATANVPNGATINADVIEKTIIPVTGEVDVTSSTTLVSVASCPLTAGKTYAVTGYFPVSSASSIGAKMGLVATGGLTVTSMSRTVAAVTASAITVGNATALDTTSGGAGASTVVLAIKIDAVLVVNVAGTLNAEGAQNASGATTTKFLINGYLRCERTN